MKWLQLVSILLFGFLIKPAFSQTTTNDEITVKFGGYINWAANYDTRQTVSFREGYLLLYPAEEKMDAYGNDINAKANFNFLAIQTRLNSKIDGPQALGAKTSGFVEAEFFGTSDGDVNGLRLRHAYLSFKWANTSLLIGQTWHPMFITEAFPQVISFNTGIPFQPFSRNPQIRVTQTVGDFNIIAALLSQRDFTNNGPSGFSSVYLRNSGVPAAHLQVQYKSAPFLAGIGGDFKELVPRIETTKKASTNKALKSFAGIAYAKYSENNFTVIAEGVYGQNMTDYLMLGGYGICDVDTLTGEEDYSNIGVYSLWSDISYGTDFQVGIFTGYSKNMGSDEAIKGGAYTRVSNIDNILRISPRVLYNSGKIRLGVEVEITKANYGTPDLYGKVSSVKEISNTRLLFSTFYFF